ncbi:conjugal transfer protein TraG N-terminal domain-containing protein [Vibrio mediterranei]|uniref:conjugal transfer protein TraG N-terminal domain-containing protein n=1 Tax=Vibrio mediterranei TaxID=689 RepID=UPI002284D3F2|nr:conjugal transfer protein TraG N-terminal domain-containing protein [Vibrio mediterranei]MCY9855401.1 conjugal transfer protein TraG N-terminal domain-containing protein [Vibrio mediterranei]
MFVKSKDMSTILSMVALISVPLTVMQFIGTHSPKAIITWCSVTVLVPTLLIKSTEDIQIIDASNPLHVTTVGNVPMILAFPAHFATLYMFGITDSINGIFHTNEDEQYSKTGMLYGATLVRKNLTAKIHNPQLQHLWQQYLTNCIRQDVAINNKYTYEELFSTPDMLTFLKNHSPSPLRRILDPGHASHYSAESGRFPTCKEALPVITSLFKQEATNQPNYLKRLLGADGANTAKQSALMMTAMDNANHALIDVSQNARQTILQAMVTNSTLTGLIDASDAVGADATAIRLMAAQTEIQSNAFMASTGLWAQKRIPMLQTVILLLIMCASPIVAALAMLPNMSLKVLSNTLMGYLNVASWPIVFTFINFISHAFGSAMMKSITNADGGVTYYNLAELHKTNLEMSSIAGWLMMLTPIITPFLVKGGASIMGSAAMQFAGMMNSVGGQVSKEIATGNISLGNTSENVHSYDNTHANKHDTNYLDNHSMASQQLDNGSMKHLTGRGNVYDTRGSRSTTDTNIHLGEQRSASLKTAATQSARATQTEQSSWQTAASDSWNQLQASRQTLASQESYGSGYSQNEQTSDRAALDEVYRATHDYAQSHNMSDSDAYSTLLAGRMGVSGHIGGGKDSIVGGSLNAGIEGSASTGATHTYTDGETRTDSDSKSTVFNHAMDRLESASKTHSAGDNHSKAAQSEQAYQDSLSNVASHSKQLSAAVNREQAASLLYEQSQSQNAGFNQDLSMEFQQWVEDNPKMREGTNVERLMTSNEGPERSLRNELAASFMHYKTEKEIGDKINSLPSEQIDNIQGQTMNSVADAGANDMKTVTAQGQTALKAHHQTGQDRATVSTPLYDDKQRQNTVNHVDHDVASRTEHVKNTGVRRGHHVEENTDKTVVNRGDGLNVLGEELHEMKESVKDSAKSLKNELFD